MSFVNIANLSHTDALGMHHRAAVERDNLGVYHVSFFYGDVELVERCFSTGSMADAITTAEVYVESKKIVFGDFIVDRVQ